MVTAFTVFELLWENLLVGKITSFLRIWSHLLKKSVMENVIFLCSGQKRNQYPYKHLR